MRNTLLSSEDKKFHIDFVEYLSLQGEMLRIRSRVRLRSVFAEPAYCHLYTSHVNGRRVRALVKQHSQQECTVDLSLSSSWQEKGDVFHTSCVSIGTNPIQRKPWQLRTLTGEKGENSKRVHTYHLEVSGGLPSFSGIPLGTESRRSYESELLCSTIQG